MLKGNKLLSKGINCSDPTVGNHARNLPHALVTTLELQHKYPPNQKSLQVSRTKILYVFLISLMRATYTVHLIPVNFITLIKFGDKLRSSSLFNFLQPPATSYLSAPNNLLSTLFSDILNLGHLAQKRGPGILSLVLYKGDNEVCTMYFASFIFMC